MKLLLVLSALLLTACSQNVHIFPETEILHDAATGVPYSARIEITGGRVMHRKEPGVISPNNSGLYLEYCDPTSAAKSNCLEIKGTPVNPGTITLYLRGMVFGNMFVSPGRFEKTYLIKVVAGKE